MKSKRAHLPYSPYSQEKVIFIVRFSKKIQGWIPQSKNRFCVSLLNRLIQDHSDNMVHQRDRRILTQSGFFERNTTKYDIIRVICLAKKYKIRFCILESNLGFSWRNAPLVCFRFWKSKKGLKTANPVSRILLTWTAQAVLNTFYLWYFIILF